jgi:hypothetical protein
MVRWWVRLREALVAQSHVDTTSMIESSKIVFVCIIAAVLYGVVHDQITARICLEYFTVFHPPVFVTQSPTLLAFGWGIIATWWMGAFLGVLLALAARAGSYPKLSAINLLKPIGKLLGLLGFVLTQRGIVSPPPWVALSLPQEAHARFMADWWTHNASYAVAFFGGIALCILQYRKRIKVGQDRFNRTI